MSDQLNTNSALRQTPVAIVGLAGIFPQAENLQEYWDNIVKEVDSITDVPPSRWEIDDYYDPDPTAPDKTYCKRGGFMPDIDFNPMEFGLPPNILEVTDASQLLSLVVAKMAMNDAGYGEDVDFNRDRTGVVLGVGGGQKLITPLTSRLQYPVWERALESSGIPEAERAQIIEKMKKAYIRWEENSFPGMLGNVISGRVANRLDLGGMNCVVDAACAASLAAVKMAVTELTDHRADMMITGGVDTDNSIFMYLSFSKTPAFSRKNDIRPFDADSDGMMIGEAVGMVVLKR
ncbi:MAG: beta-ketoacyl synthase N-terminal-like domain-containing protein, partial [Chloroflexota bacterium]